MKEFFVRFLRLLGGLFLYALGIVFTLKANIGYAPWDVFHSGLSQVTGLSFGFASISVGVGLVVATALLGEKVGMGTLLNMVLIGLMLDLLLAINIIPIAGGPIIGVIMLIGGLFILATGTYFYIGSGFGAGPRDGTMVALTRITGLPVGVCRGVVEFTALAAGWLLGGMVGIGTVISVLAVGFCVQLTFKLFKFKPTEVVHETLDQTLKRFVSSGDKTAEVYSASLTSDNTKTDN